MVYGGPAPGSLSDASSTQISAYEFLTQSSRFCEDCDNYDVDAINKLLRTDLLGRTVEVTDKNR